MKLTQNNQFDASWVKITTTLAPDARIEQNWVYDTLRDKMIMIGGRNGPELSDTWEYDGKSSKWVQLNTTNQPELAFFGAAYDSKNDKIITFGGIRMGTPIQDTWEFDPLTKNWNQKFPENVPDQRLNPEIVYDPIKNKIIMFGGGRAKILLGDTWEYDLAINNWTELHPQFSPSPRTGHTMIYNPLNGKILMFGGGDKLTGLSANVFNDTCNNLYIHRAFKQYLS